jgi:hypothetical protein
MAAKNGATKNGVAKWERVKGVVRVHSGEFLPYPLPVFRLEINDDGYYAVEMSVSKDDPKAWGDGKGDSTPLAVEFKVRFFMNEGDGRYLVQRAQELGIDPDELPQKTTLPVTDREERAVFKALQAIREALWYPMLRWANLAETTAPSALRVPAKVRVPVGKDHLFAEYIRHRGNIVAVREAVSDFLGLREPARKHLKGEALNAFDEYCGLWDRKHKEVESK